MPKRRAKRTKAALVLAVCCALLAGAALAALRLARTDPEQRVHLCRKVEEHIHNGRSGIAATVYLPLEEGEGWPLVVMCHGFTGSRAGDGHFERLATRLAQNGIASVSLDFPGCGESAEDSAAYTLSNMQADVTTAIAHMSMAYRVDTEKVALVGHSMGGRLASLYLAGGAEEYPICAAALWSPSNGDGLNGLEFLDIENFAHVEALAQEAEETGTAVAWEFTMSGTFFAEMAQSHPNAALADYDGAVLLCYSGHEDILSQTTVQQTIAAVEAKEKGTVLLAPFADAGHNYTAYDPAAADTMDAVLSDALCTATAEFLTKELKPDWKTRMKDALSETEELLGGILQQPDDDSADGAG